MALYSLTATSAVVRTSDGAAVPADPENQDFQAYLEWFAAGNTPAPYAAPVPALSSLEFIARFTPAEQTAIVTAAQTMPALMLWLITCAGANFIDLTDPRTAAGLDQLIAAGLLAPARKPVILGSVA